MRKRPRGIQAAFAAALLMTGVSQAADPAEAKTIGRVVRERADLSTFLQLLDKTEVGSQLSERTNIRRTVFAPIDAAFAKLPKKSLSTLLDPKNDDRLEEVFGFHVLNRSVPAFGLEKFSTLQMTTGQFLSIDYSNGKIGGARFTGETIPCSNGTIYLVDQVLTPNTDDLFQRLQKDGRFTIFTKAITASRQGKLFQNMHGLYTTFAPTDEAFAKLPKEFVDSLFLPENDERLEDIIKHHIVDGVLAAGKVPGFLSLGVSDVTPISAFGQQINFKADAAGVTVDGAKVLQADIPCANGIIHVIDSVIPPVDSGLLALLRKDDRYSTLVSLLDATGLSLAVASSSQYTIFAPVNEAWKKEPFASLAADPTGENREALYGILARHVITGKHVSENCRPYNKLRTIHGAPIYLTRSGVDRKISGISISETDNEGFNGLINAIDSVIPDPMELPEGDITTIDAIKFVQTTLSDASAKYGEGKYEESWRHYTAKGYEFLSKYSQFLTSAQRNSLETAIRDDQPVYQFASEAWTSRNAFRTVLRDLEQREDRILDSYLMQRPDKKRFGR
ncbi:MAG: fasciclin domain-containing protein [Akkermansiaceae bacterium]|nr:fasciclin domain-containing protein [Akkermansiaceae bacterium]